MTHPTPQGQLSLPEPFGFITDGNPNGLRFFHGKPDRMTELINSTMLVYTERQVLAATESLRAEVEALREAALEAANVIEQGAESLREGHSVNGEWQESHPADAIAKDCYDDDMALVKRLRALSQQSGSEVKNG